MSEEKITIGEFVIKWHDEDHLEITDTYVGKVYICGADMESLLSGLCSVRLEVR